MNDLFKVGKVMSSVMPQLSCNEQKMNYFNSRESFGLKFQFFPIVLHGSYTFNRSGKLGQLLRFEGTQVEKFRVVFR